MLILDHPVPPALLLPEPVSDLREHLSAQSAHWFSAQSELVTCGVDAPQLVSALQSCTSEVTAHRTRPNKGNSLLCADASEGLAFQEELHCGFRITDLAGDDGDWSAALRFSAPEHNARTLFTLNTGAVDNYIFLQQVAGVAVLKDQRSTLEISAAASSTEQPLVIIAGQAQDRLWLRVAGGPIQSTSLTAPIDLPGPREFYIGCRSNKGRLKKTLGRFDLYDLILWPECNILSNGPSETLDALDDPTLWRPTK